MPQPTAGDVYVNIPLTNVSLSYYQDDTNFIADRMLPLVPSTPQSGIVWEWDLAYILKNEMQPRGESAESAGIGSKLNQLSYLCAVTALHKDISDQRRANETAPINADKNATTQLTAQAMQKREITLKANAFKTGLWTGQADQAGVASAPTTNQFVFWSVATADPVADVTRWKTAIQLKTGVKPRRMAFGQPVLDALKTNPSIIDRLKYSGTPGSTIVVSLQALATMFEVDDILVSSVVQATSNEGAATLTTAFVIAKELLLYSTPPSPDIDTPSAGYTFAWQGYLGANAFGARIKKFRMEHLASDRVEIEQAYDQKILAPTLGGYASAVVA